jgi:hypothetical protein
MTSSFEDAVKEVLGENYTPKKPRVKIEEGISGGLTTSGGGVGGAGVIDRGGSNVVSTFNKYSGADSQSNNGNIKDIGRAEEAIAKNHPHTIFPLEQIPINIITAGEKISDELVNIDVAIKNNKVLTDAKKNELRAVKNLIKTVLGNIRKAASMIDAIQN